MAFWFIPAAVVVVATLGKIVYETVTKDNSSSTTTTSSSASSSFSSDASSTSGPSREDLNKKKESAICLRAVDEATEFMRAHNEQITINSCGLNINPYSSINCSNLQILKGVYIPYLNEYNAQQINDERQIDMTVAGGIARSLNRFEGQYNVAVSISESHQEKLQQKQLLEEILEEVKQTEGDSQGIQEKLESCIHNCATADELRGLLRLWQELSKNIGTGAPSLMVCGKLKAGKSSLLNILTDHFEDNPPFEVDDVRSTIEEQMLEYAGIRYVDTPGLDATEEDDEKVWHSFMKADGLIFVHALNGELDQQELDSLTRLNEERPLTADNLLMVLTHAEGELSTGTENLKRLMNRIEKQVIECLGGSRWTVAVSNTSYRRGRREHKQGLVEISNIPHLQSYIYYLRDHLGTNADDNRKREIATVKQKIYSLIDEDIKNKKREINECKISDEIVYANMFHEYREICLNWHKEVTAYDSM